MGILRLMTDLENVLVLVLVFAELTDGRRSRGLWALVLPAIGALASPMAAVSKAQADGFTGRFGLVVSLIGGGNQGVVIST